MLTSLLVNTQHRQDHGINIVSPVSIVLTKQVRIVYVDDTNLWEGLEDNKDLLSAIQKGQEKVETWARVTPSSERAPPTTKVHLDIS